MDLSLNPSELCNTVDSPNVQAALPSVINDAATFDAFYDQFITNVQNLIQNACKFQVTMALEQKNINPCPLFSATHEGCNENGMDYTAGGAKYNISTICLCGIATLIDSLYAIKTLVFDRREISLSDFSEILLSNWENQEALRHRCMSLPKYGHGIKDVDLLAHRFLGDVNHFVTQIPNERGGKNILSMFSYYLYRTFAPYVRATADGRKDGDYFSQGISPSHLQKSNSSTEIFETIKNVDYSRISGISVLDTLFAPCLDKYRLAAFIKSAGESKCANLQPNLLSPEELMDAKVHPENHKDLIVRVAGLSVYFVNLEEAIQDEIINRNFCM